MQLRHLAVLMIVGLSGAAQAALIDRGGGMIYDSVLDITWLQDANLGGSSSWDASVALADNLDFGGFDDWRLPSMDVNLDNTIVDCGTATEMDCQDNELGYMFYYNMITSSDPGLFSNVQLFHWSGTEFAFDPSLAWFFFFSNGFQSTGSKFQPLDLGVWAVRSGDVAVVPLPAGIWLLGSGLVGLMGVARRGRRRC